MPKNLWPTLAKGFAGFLAGFVLWWALSSPYARLLASVSETLMRLAERPPVTRLAADGTELVIDRDDFPLANYHRAFELARVNGLKVAWANEAFELWYLLHFNYHDTGISRHDYKAKLKPHFNYDKAGQAIYQKVKPHEATALRNAQRLERHWNELGEKYPERQNPSTSVHKLVEFLNELSELGSAG